MITNQDLELEMLDAYYESGVFYISTYALSNKMKQIALNDQVAISANFEDFHSSGIAKNLGWVLDPSNAELRLKLRQAFANWFMISQTMNQIQTVVY